MCNGMEAVRISNPRRSPLRAAMSGSEVEVEVKVERGLRLELMISTLDGLRSTVELPPHTSNLNVAQGFRIEMPQTMLHCEGASLRNAAFPQTRVQFLPEFIGKHPASAPSPTSRLEALRRYGKARDWEPSTPVLRRLPTAWRAPSVLP